MMRPRDSFPQVAVRAAAVCLVLVLGVAVSAQDVSLEALQEKFAREQQRQADLAFVETSRETAVISLVDAWAPTAQERGYGPGWAEELRGVLMPASAEKLVAAGKATTYEALRGTLLGTVRIVRGEGAAAVTPRQLGDTDKDLVFNALTPCRLFDTRLAGGLLAANTTRDFVVNGDLVPQGGNPAGCGVPVDPKAVAINLTITQAQGFGNLRAFPFSDPIPLASVINYDGSEVALANGIIVPMCQLCGPDLTIRADVSGTHVLADVVGYFWSPEATRLDWTYVGSSQSVGVLGGGFNRTATCPGTHQVTGGGHSYSGIGALSLTTSWATLTNGWNCIGSIGVGGGGITCEAECARVPGR